MYVGRCGSKNGYQKDMCLEDIGLCAQNMITMIGSIVNIIWKGGGGVYIPCNEHENIYLNHG